MSEQVGNIGKQSERIVNLMLPVQPKPEEQLDQDKDNPAPSKVIAPNIRTILHLRKEAAREYKLLDPIADPVTPFSGSQSL